VVLLGTTVGTVLGFYVQEQLIQRHKRQTAQYIDEEVEKRIALSRENSVPSPLLLDNELKETIGFGKRK